MIALRIEGGREGGIRGGRRKSTKGEASPIAQALCVFVSVQFHQNFSMCALAPVPPTFFIFTFVLLFFFWVAPPHLHQAEAGRIRADPGGGESDLAP